MPSNRYSVVSTSETYASGGGGTQENNPLFRQSQSFASMSQYAQSSPEARVDPSSMSQLALPAARGFPIGRDPSPGSSTESGHAARLERGPSDDPSSFTHSSASYSPYTVYPNETYHDEAEQPILPTAFASSSTSSPEPAYIQPGHYSSNMYAEPDSIAPQYQQQQQQQQRQQAPPRTRQHSQHGRGVSLVDTGPVPVAPHDPVRRVSRHQRRSSSRNQLVSPVSSSSHNLPPGAVSGGSTVAGLLTDDPGPGSVLTNTFSKTDSGHLPKLHPASPSPFDEIIHSRSIPLSSVILPWISLLLLIVRIEAGRTV